MRGGCCLIYKKDTHSEAPTSVFFLQQRQWSECFPPQHRTFIRSWTVLQRPWDTFQQNIYMIILGCVSMEKTEKLNTIIFVSRLELVDSAKAVVFSPVFYLLVSTKGSFFTVEKTSG